MTYLIHNEMLKLLRKKRLLVIMLIFAVIVSMFTYAQFRTTKHLQERLGTTDWRTTLQQQIVDTQNRLGSSSISDDWKKELRIRLDQQQYYLDHNIDPAAPGAATFLRKIMENAINLLLPLMVMVVASDMVSSEYSMGTIKLLLTRPVKRWKILLSKYISMIFSVSLILLLFSMISYAISGTVFGYGGWDMPVLTGFSAQGGEFDASHVTLLPQWEYIFMEGGLVWFVCLVVGTLSFMISVLVRSTAAGMGIMLAALISGVILNNMVSSWESAKYLFMVNMRLTDYMSGMAPPVPGMSLGFSLVVLACWGVAGLFVSLLVFTRKDVY